VQATGFFMHAQTKDERYESTGKNGNEVPDRVSRMESI
jgi:hypothetical protein